jgi:SAM-dependent methyltransferase
MTVGLRSAFDLHAHNLRQRRYFEGSPKRGMRPAETPYLQRHVDELLRVADVRVDDHLLEVGCGMGRYTLILAQRGLRAEGLDLSPVLLDRLRAFDGGRFNIPLHCADVAASPPDLHACFDAVVGFFTLHHVHDLTLCFQAIVQLLKPGGRVVFLEPNPFNPLYYVQMVVTPGMTWQGDGGIVRMRPEVVFGAMRRAGLANLTLDRFGFFPPRLANAHWGPAAEVALERLPVLRPVLPFQLFKGERR